MNNVFELFAATLDNNDDFKKFVLRDLSGAEEVDTIYINNSMAIVVTICDDDEDSDITLIRPFRSGRVGDHEQRFVRSVEKTIKTTGISSPVLRKRALVKWKELIKGLELSFSTDNPCEQGKALADFLIADSAEFRLR